MTKILKSYEESGRSMVEMLGVLAIVGVLSIGGIAGYSKAMAKYKVNKTLDQVSMLITNVRTAFGNQVSYAGLTTASAILYEIAGNDLSLGSDSTLTNAFNGDVTVDAITSSGGACTVAEGGDITDAYCPSFKIVFEGIERSACATIVSSDWGGTASSGLVSISVGGTEHTWDDDGLPISYVTAFEDCDVVGGATIEWVYN